MRTIVNVTFFRFGEEGFEKLKFEKGSKQVCLFRKLRKV